MYFNTCLAESGPSYWETSEKQIQNACRGSLDERPECARKSVYLQPCHATSARRVSLWYGEMLPPPPETP